MRLKDKIHQVLVRNGILDKEFNLSREIAIAISKEPAVGFDGTLRRDRKGQHTKDRQVLENVLHNK